jgi:hypothetical protein
MSLLERLERKFRRYGVPHVTVALIACQVAAYLAAQGRPQVLEVLALVPARVLEGELWRPVTFLFTPPLTHPIFAFFFWYLFYLMGTALEAHWGAFRYNVYLVIGWLATAGVSFLTPEAPASPAFLQGSVFLAFALLFPDFVLHVFFILPLKIKWLALLTWIGYFLAVIYGTWTTRLLVGASVLNFFLFFGAAIARRMRSGHRRMARQASTWAKKDEPFHRCTVCGITDRTHPDMDFRYCSKCDGQHGYCTEHIFNHEHVVDREK